MERKTNDMTLDEYQEKAMTTLMESSDNDVYAFSGLTAEIGEINDKIAKWTRKGWIGIEHNCIEMHDIPDDGMKDCVMELVKEAGDVLWFVALLARRLGLDLGTVAEINLQKLASRKERGVIDGNGDNR